MENETSFSFAADINFSCLAFFPAGIGKVGIRNNCDKCMTAVVNWTPTVGVRNYNVQGFSQIIIDVLSSNGQLIGEQPC